MGLKYKRNKALQRSDFQYISCKGPCLWASTLYILFFIACVVDKALGFQEVFTVNTDRVVQTTGLYLWLWKGLSLVVKSQHRSEWSEKKQHKTVSLNILVMFLKIWVYPTTDFGPYFKSFKKLFEFYYCLVVLVRNRSDLSENIKGLKKKNVSYD